MPPTRIHTAKQLTRLVMIPCNIPTNQDLHLRIRGTHPTPGSRTRSSFRLGLCLHRRHRVPRPGRKAMDMVSLRAGRVPGMPKGRRIRGLGLACGSEGVKETGMCNETKNGAVSGCMHKRRFVVLGKGDPGERIKGSWGLGVDRFEFSRQGGVADADKEWLGREAKYRRSFPIHIGRTCHPRCIYLYLYTSWLCRILAIVKAACQSSGQTRVFVPRHGGVNVCIVGHLMSSNAHVCRRPSGYKLRPLRWDLILMHEQARHSSLRCR